MRIQKILVPTDFSASADLALDGALTLASALDARVTLFHAFELPLLATRAGGAPFVDEANRALEAAARQKLAAVLEDAKRRSSAKKLSIDARFAVGDARDAIIEDALVFTDDLIVMGTHGRSGLRHMLIGSVAERVVRTAPCLVLVVPSRLGLVTAENPAWDDASRAKPALEPKR
jgi:nucleotide-binding universal stress UspA family protein